MFGDFLAYGGTNNVIHNQTTYGIGDQVSWSKGTQTFRFGGEWEDTRWTWVGSWLSHGIMAFQTFDDFLIGLPGACGAAVPGVCNGSAFSNVLNTSNFDVASSPSGIVHGYRMKNADLFIQDDWKVSPRLTINVGLRWEYDGLLSDKYGNAVNMWPSQVLTVPMPVTTQTPTYGQPLFPAGGTYAGWVVPSNFSTSTYGPLSQWPGILNSGNLVSVKSGTPLDDFAPRLGFAYQPTSNNKLVLRGGFGFFFDRIDGNNIVHSIEQSPPYAPTLDQPASTNQFSSLATPFENYTVGEFPERWVNFAQANLPNSAQTPFLMSSNITQTSMYQTMQTPLMYEWNFNIQYNFFSNWVLEVGYVGSHGIHQSENLQLLNEAQLASPSNPIWGMVTENTINNASLRVPFLGMSPGGMQYADTNGALKYNALQVTARKQLSRGLQMQVSYTWARAFDDFEGPGGSNFGDPNNLQQQYGLNTQYRPQRLTINYLYQFPGRNLKGAAGALLGGWSLSGITTIQDGFPLVITDSRGGAIFGLSGSPATVLSRAEMAPGMTYADIATPGPVSQRLGGASGGPGYLNVNAFTTIPIVGATPGVAGTGGTGWGNSGIGPILGPGQFNFDTALAKSTRVGGVHENALLMFRAEFFNLFNHPQFGQPITGGGLYTPVNTNLGVPSSFGTITAMSVNPRLIQLALKYVF
jgi:TonB dependent receptor